MAGPPTARTLRILTIVSAFDMLAGIILLVGGYFEEISGLFVVGMALVVTGIAVQLVAGVLGRPRTP
jgi:hypothetical protein